MVLDDPIQVEGTLALALLALLALLAPPQGHHGAENWSSARRGQDAQPALPGNQWRVGWDLYA